MSQTISPGRADDHPVVVGLDIGGTSTKAWVLDVRGRVRGRARAAGGNHRSSVADHGRHLQDAVSRALGEVAPRRVVAVSAGIAGAGSAAGTEVQNRVLASLRALGVQAPTDVRTDLDIAFLAAVPDGDGALLLSGTGAVAARYRGSQLAQRCDGLGWRLGDEGSGWWIGSAALRAGAAALDGRSPDSLLVPRLTEALTIPALTGDPRQDWVRVAAVLDPPAMAALVPLVLACARDGDAVAVALLDEAAARLLASFDVIESGEPGLQVALAGGVLGAAGPVREGVVTELQRRGHVVAPSREPVLGALVLAAGLAGWPAVDPSQISSAH